MKRAILTLCVVALAAGTALAGVSKEDIKKLLAAGVSEQVILAYIKSNGPVDKLSAEDIAELKKDGATDQLLEQVLKPQEAAQTPRQEPAPAPQAPATPAPRLEAQPWYMEPRSAAPAQAVYVEPSTSYVYREYWPGPSGVTSVYCTSHRTHDHCYARTTYYYPSAGYYQHYSPTYRYSYYGHCSPSWGFTYHRHGRHSSWSAGVRW